MTTPLRITIPRQRRDAALAAQYNLTLDDLSEFDGIDDAMLMDAIEQLYDASTEILERVDRGRQCVGDDLRLRKMDAWAKKAYVEVMMRQADRHSRRRVATVSPPSS